MDIDKLFKVVSFILTSLINLKKKPSHSTSHSTYSEGRKKFKYSDPKEILNNQQQQQTREEEEDERFLASGMSAQQQEIWDLVDAAESAPASIDASTLKRMVLKFEKILTKNQELRIKYAQEPSKFIESEADLDEEIKNLNGISSYPDLYPLLIQLGTLNSILSLLAHENTDIVIATVSLLNEWTDEDVVAQGSLKDLQGMQSLVSSLVCFLFFKSFKKVSKN